MTQQSSDGQNLTGEFRQWRIPAGWLIQIELAWLIVAAIIGGYLSGLPEGNWWAWAYHTFTGGNVLGLFVLGNMAGYLVYEEVRMVLSGIYHREKVEDILAVQAESEAKLKAERDGLSAAEAELVARQAELVARQAEVKAEQAELEAKQAEVEAKQAEVEVEQAEAKAEAAAARATAARAEARAARAEAIVAAQPEGEAQAAAAAREAERAAVAAWYERQQAAQRAGLPFAEPPPGYDNGGKGGGAVC